MEGDIAALAASFQRALRARNRSQRTVRTYLEAVGRLTEHLSRTGAPAVASHIRREHVEAFIAEQLASHKPNTAATRYRALQQLFRWLVEEGELAASPMAGMRPPSVPDSLPAILTEDELRGLLRACDGRDFASRRDTAIVRLFCDTGLRLSELTGIRLADLDMDGGSALVMGKGGRPRLVPFGSRTAASLDRYLRLRARHRHAGAPALWLGHAGSLTPGRAAADGATAGAGGRAGGPAPARLPALLCPFFFGRRRERE